MIESIVLGLGHRARHGKDAVANEIIKQRSGLYDIRKYSFAQELKREVVKAALGSGGMKNLFDDGLRVPGAGYMQANGDFIALPDWVQYDPNPDMTDPDCPLGKQRFLLQWWGTEYRRSIDSEYWIKRVAVRIEDEKPEIAILTDMRFLNEMQFAQKYGDAIKVERRNPDGSLYVAPGLVSHISEEALANVPDSQWDAILVNDGTVEDLKRKALYTFDALMEKVQVKK